MSITREEWMRELERVSSASGEDGISRQEIEDLLGITTIKARVLLKMLHKEGRLSSFKSKRTRIDGETARVSVYRIAPPGGE